jgi:hypothetical protein
MMFRRVSDEEYRLSGYVDADYAADKDDRVSRTGYVIFLGVDVIHWRSINQGGVSLFSECFIKFED